MKNRHKVAFLLAALSVATATQSVNAKPVSRTAASISSQVQNPLPFDVMAGRGGIIRITPLIHASIQIEYSGKIILVDPISAGSYRKKADLILITHSHPDHLDVKTIAGTYKQGGIIVVPQSISASDRLALGKVVGGKVRFYSATDQVRILESLNGKSTGGNSYEIPIKIDGVPMYNIMRGPKPGRKFHPKGVGLGYILTLGGKRIYIAGDSEATPEMKALKNIDAAFIPMNLPYTMTPQEAAAGVRAFKPKVVYPYHFRYPFNQPNTTPQQFIQAMKGSGVRVRVLDWYNAVPVARFMAASAANR